MPIPLGQRKNLKSVTLHLCYPWINAYFVPFQGTSYRVPCRRNTETQNMFYLINTVRKLLSEVQPWTVKLMWPKSATRFGKKLSKSATRFVKKSPKSATRLGKKSTKVAKNHQSVKNSPKGQKFAKNLFFIDVAKKCYQIWQKAQCILKKHITFYPE